jgi:hypothetical protein
MLADEKQLNLYLKKSKLFDNIGIIGVVNKYLEQIGKIANLKNPYENFSEKEAIDKPVNDLEAKLKDFASISPLPDKQKEELITILSEISYEQIGIVANYLEKISYQNPPLYRSKFEFLITDWRFDLVGDFDDESIRKEFFENYSKMTQAELYAFYLTKNEFDFRKPDKSLDFDKIYEMLKYDVVEALAGGGGGRREKHIYSLVKWLENEFKTTLNFSNKLCKSRNIYGCSTGSRAREWMKFLIKNGHLKLAPNEPTSFTLK